MTLFFEERIKEDPYPFDNNIVFTFPWIIEITPQDGDRELNFSEDFGTSYQYRTRMWSLELRPTGITVSDKCVDCDESIGSSCFISYNLFYDDDMRFLIHSTPRLKIAKTPKAEIFQTPNGFMTKFVEYFNKKKLSKAVIHIELHMPWLYNRFNNPLITYKKSLFEYPPDMENHYKFVFLKWSDYSVKCPDGEVPALKIVLNHSSKFMRDYLCTSNDNELALHFSIDVVKPVIYFLHSLCFEMPKVYDLEYVGRLFELIDFFEPVQKADLVFAIQESLARKFVEEPINNFDLLLHWLKIACQQSFHGLLRMITLLIVQKYYFKWHQVFPENARNMENPIYLFIFDVTDEEMCLHVFFIVEEMMMDSFKTNVILP